MISSSVSQFLLVLSSWLTSASNLSFRSNKSSQPCKKSLRFFWIATRLSCHYLLRLHHLLSPPFNADLKQLLELSFNCDGHLPDGLTWYDISVCFSSVRILRSSNPLSWNYIWNEILFLLLSIKVTALTHIEWQELHCGKLGGVSGHWQSSTDWRPGLQNKVSTFLSRFSITYFNITYLNLIITTLIGNIQIKKWEKNLKSYYFQNQKKSNMAGKNSFNWTWDIWLGQLVTLLEIISCLMSSSYSCPNSSRLVGQMPWLVVRSSSSTLFSLNISTSEYNAPFCLQLSIS